MDANIKVSKIAKYFFFKEEQVGYDFILSDHNLVIGHWYFPEGFEETPVYFRHQIIGGASNWGQAMSKIIDRLNIEKKYNSKCWGGLI